MGDSDNLDILLDHLFTLDSFLRVNGFKNTRPPQDFENLTPQEFFLKLQREYNKNPLSRLQGAETLVEDKRNNLSGIFYNDDGEKIFVYFAVNETKCVQTFLKYLCMIEDCVKAIIVTDRELSSNGKKDIQNISCDSSNKSFTIKYFTDKTFNDITVNVMTPDVMKVLQGQDVKQFESENKVNSQKVSKNYSR